jgi:glycosyltransferase involved in cell wall biosynthesis
MEAWLEEGTKRSAEAVTVISSVLRERALSLGISEERIVLVPSGADVESIQVEDKAECRRELGWDEKGLYLGFVGFAVWDLRILFEAFRRVLKDLPDVKLAWVGKDKDGVFPGLEREFGLGDSLIRLGEVPYDGISKVLGAMDVHLLPLADNPANRARWPNKLGDYLASGRPVVTMDVGDAGTFVKEHKVGVASKPDPESFATAILSLARDQALCNEMGKRAREAAETVCPWDRSVQILEDLYCGRL